MLIAHTASSSEDETALTHAVSLAANGKARLASVHACAGPNEARELPPASHLLRRWGLPEGSVVHERILHVCCEDVTDTLLDALRKLGPDLIVSATHARTGLARLFSGSIAEAVARNATVPTLLLPVGGQGFVDRDSGRANLRRILVPAGSREEAQSAVDAAVALTRLAGAVASEIALAHVADGRAAPEVELPAGFSLVRHEPRGSIEATLIALAQRLDANLVVMATRGHDGVADVVLGSATERVLHGLGRPLLWLPLASARRPP